LGWIPFKKKGVLYYGFDLNKYKDIKPFPIKETLKIDNDAIIILYVGKLDPLKNPIYLLDVLRILNNPLVYYLLVGEGPEEQKIIQKAIELGLQNNVKFLGWRNDVYSIMLASNVFVFPRVEHEKEGFGKVIIEAQAAGLPAIITTGIPQDAVFLKNLADTLPLQNSEKLWAERLSVILNSKKPNQLNGLNVLMNSHFEIKNGTNNLLDLYR
jgi:glycosyltransferase involved in cell wall biosynthesis